MISCEEKLDISGTDVVSWAFGGKLVLQKPVWVDSYDDSSYVDKRTAQSLVKKLICGFRRHGLSQGDVVCLHSFNSIWYPAIYLAIIGAGGIFVGSNPAFKSQELDRLFSSTKSKYLVVQATQLHNVLSSALSSGIPTDNIFVIDEDPDSTVNQDTGAFLPNSHSWRELLSHGEEDWTSFNDIDQSKNTPAVYLLSSGTTGLPKVVVMSHYALVTQLVLSNYQTEEAQYEVRRLITLPLFHSFALPFPILSLRRCESMFLMPRFVAEDCCTFITQHKITMIPVVPPMAKKLFKSNSGAKRPDFSSLRDVMCAGTSLDAATQRDLAKRLGASTKFVQLWGMSELGWTTAFRCTESNLEGSVGRILPNITAKLIDEKGKDLRIDAPRGEICIKSPGVMTEYLDNKSATEGATINGWFRTGDIGYCEDGKWYIVDRAKDMIKVRGWQVSPAEIEACLVKHEMVADAAVIGIPDDFSGEKPLAFVVPNDHVAKSPEVAHDIKTLVADSLASYKSLDGGIVFVDSIPRAVSGKILRRLLRAQISLNPPAQIFSKKVS